MLLCFPGIMFLLGKLVKSYKASIRDYEVVKCIRTNSCFIKKTKYETFEQIN